MPRRPRLPHPDQLALPLDVPADAPARERGSPDAMRTASADASAVQEPLMGRAVTTADLAIAAEPPGAPLPPLDPATARLSDVVLRFLEFSAAIDRSNYTLDALRLDLALLIRYLGDVVASGVSLDDLRRYAVWLRQERKNDSRSLRRKVASVKAFFAYTRQINLRDDDPAERLIYPTLEPRVPEILEADEASKLVAAAERPLWRAVVLTLLDTGLKRDELLALHPADVYVDPDDATRGYVVVRATDQARRIRARSLPLTPRLADELKRQIATGAGERIFPISVRAVNFIVQSCGERAGVRKRGTISPQMLRDTFAVNVVRRRVALENQRRLAGATLADLAALRHQHDQEVCDLLGLTPGETNDPIARYRVLA